MEDKTVNLFVMDSDKALRGLRTGLKRHEEKLSRQSGHILILGLATLGLAAGWQQQAKKLAALEKRIESKNNESVE